MFLFLVQSLADATRFFSSRFVNRNRCIPLVQPFHLPVFIDLFLIIPFFSLLNFQIYNLQTVANEHVAIRVYIVQH